jgi:hypothetical protein
VLIPLLVLLHELTGSGLWGALPLAIDTGTMALLLPYTGTVADRVDRKKIMMTANLTADAAWLKDSARDYPVTIDPTSGFNRCRPTRRTWRSTRATRRGTSTTRTS